MKISIEYARIYAAYIQPDGTIDWNRFCEDRKREYERGEACRRLNEIKRKIEIVGQKLAEMRKNHE